MKVRVRIEQKHIIDYNRGSCIMCPIALALNEKGFTNSFVGGYITTYKDYVRYDAKHTIESRKFADNFDKGRGVVPTTLELEFRKW